ncbi:MAG: NAD(P)/FAD-dependent oxidoreductase [Planctomycetota bacterium]
MVGAGPVGLFTALVLTSRGVRVQVVDRAAHTGTRSYALALHAEALRLFEEFGLLAPALEHARRIRTVGLYDGERRRGELRLTDLAEDHSFVSVLPQSALEQLLEKALAERGVHVDWCHSVQDLRADDGGVDVTIDRLSLDTLGYSVQHAEWVVAKTTEQHFPFVIGADGNASVVRRRLDIGFPVYGDRTEFSVYEFRTDADLGSEMRLGFDRGATSVCWPMPGNICRWSFQRALDAGSADRQKDQSLVQPADERHPDLTDERLLQLLRHRAPWFHGNVLGIRWRMEVRFENRLADSFGRGRTWLVGDAGHLTGPAGIQSMNVGLREAIELASGIADAVQGRGTVALERYDQARRTEWRALLGLDPLLQPTPSADPWLVDNLARLLPCVPASGRDLVQLMAQVGISSKSGLFAAAR